MMIETVVHVTTLDQWKSVLDVWFKQGYEWRGGRRGYQIYFFENHLGRHLKLGRNHEISYWSLDGCNESFIEYADFMAQKKEDNKMETHYVTQEQFDLIDRLNDECYPLLALAMNTFAYGSDFEEKFDPNILFTDEFIVNSAVSLTKYLGGDETVEFKVKEPLYRLWRIDDDGDKVYMRFSYGTPGWAMSEENAFKAPLEEIKKWQTPAWEIEKVEE